MYRDSTILCNADFNEIERVWHLTVAIAWQVGEHLHWHTLMPPKPFETKEEAVAEGFRLGELWVDERL
jgi:hypothetical protein